MKKKTLCILLIFALMAPAVPAAAASAPPAAERLSMADSLYTMGLFRGGSDGYALDRRLTRSEAAVLLVRLLGKESIVLSGVWKAPFTDVPGWAAKYVGYAYQAELTRGVGGSRFGGGASDWADESQFSVFLLRALGYSEADGDFTYAGALSFAASLGLSSGGSGAFLRADAVTLSYEALALRKKGSDRTLLQSLVDAGAVPASRARAAGLSSLLTSGSGSSELDAEELYDLCSPAVFSLTAYDSDGDEMSSGSGFFIESGGLAVTNYHVIADAFSATVKLSGGAEYPVSGVLAYDIKKDLALLKIDGGPFPALTVGDSASLRSGQAVYAIGSPLGLDNTIAQGIVSSPSRKDYDGMIQISVPLSHGSSGGALLAADGSVVGVTAAGLTEGENLNFAIPVSELSSLTRGPALTLPQVAAAATRYAYENRPAAFDDNVDETEPNNDPSQAVYLDNGVTLWGSIDDDEPDLFLLRCDTPGTIKVTLSSDEPDYLVRDLNLFLLTADYGDYSSAKYVEASDGSVSLSLEYTVTGPGVFILGVTSSHLAQYFNPKTTYAFYYEFIPR